MLTDAEKNRRETIIKIQSYLSQGYSSKAICEMMHTTYRQIRKFSIGDPDILCCSNKLKSNSLCRSELDQYKNIILEQLALKAKIKSIYELILERGHTGKRTNFYDYCKKLIEKNDVAHPTNTNILDVKLNKNKPKGHFIERNRILKYLWSNLNIPLADIDFILERYPFLKEMGDCISDFRNIYVNKSVTLLKEFVDKYVKSNNKNLKSFANGIFKDFIAVKNSVISEYSNGFIEGNNNRLKMIKRTMYGRAGLNLLRAKIIY
ncbi:transposase [Desulfofarcimen acetoxidans]|uniref:transposase n=1 Tax=Desulfofarcimen acetoxidans TaxID=58138 RepID=UPI00019E5822|nr:transposase [Desulfofarcimen acetoxidans]